MDLDDKGSFVVMSDEEEEEEVQVVDNTKLSADTKKKQPAVPGCEDMLIGNRHCVHIELRTSKALNSLIAQVISGHHGTNRHGPFGAGGKWLLSHGSTQDSGIR